MNFKPGDVVIDIKCRDSQYSTDGLGLRGVVRNVEYGKLVWGDWLYRDKWLEDLNSYIYNVRLITDDEADRILASWTAWRLVKGD